MQVHSYQTIANRQRFRVESAPMKMKRILVWCLVLAVCLCGTSRVRAADDPGDKFLEAYFLIQEGDAAERQNDWVKADAKYKGADEILGEIKSQTPDWNPHIIEFRTKYVEDHIAQLKAKLVVAPPTEPQKLRNSSRYPATDMRPGSRPGRGMAGTSILSPRRTVSGVSGAATSLRPAAGPRAPSSPSPTFTRRAKWCKGRASTWAKSVSRWRASSWHSA